MDPAKVNNDLVTKLSQLIESLVNSGQRQLDDVKMKEIKKICRISDAYISEAYKMLLHHLNEKHSEIRLTSLLIAKELFQRSHHFRELLTANFQDFLKLVLDIDPNIPLPPPPTALKQLKVLALKTIKEWYEVYGEAYKKLKIGYQYLVKNKSIDFNDQDARSSHVRLVSQSRESKLNVIKEQRIKAICDEICNEKDEILNCVTQIENGIQLLMHDDDFLIEEDKVTDPESTKEMSNSDMRLHGMTNANFNLLIEVKPFQVEVNENNKEILQCIKEQYRLLTARMMPRIIHWNISASKLGAEEQVQKQILDLKLKVESIIKQYQELNISNCNLDHGLESSSNEDSDLETVPDTDCYKDDMILPLKEIKGLDPTFRNLPGTSECSNASSQSCTAQSKKTLPIDIDSYAKSQSSLPLPVFSRNQVESYWVQDPESGPSGADLITHPVDLSEEFSPVKWTCRAPLPSGKLCPRSDRVKCPFHGPIVARDEAGQPIDPSSVRPTRKSTVPDWQEPSLLADIKAATGVDLTMPTKGKRLKKKFPNLTNVTKNTPRTRLEKKIFTKNAVKRVAADLDKADAKHAKGKFGEQWNYNY